MDSNTLKIILIACTLSGVGMFFLVRYIGERNAKRHPLEQRRLLLTGELGNVKKQISPWWELGLGCIYILFSIIFFIKQQDHYLKWPLSICFILYGVGHMWRSIKNLINEKT